MVVKTSLLCVFLFLLGSVTVLAQCNALNTNRSIIFKTDQNCAPVTVTQFELTYNFTTAQDPASIEIVYEWNDPTNRVDVVNIGNGLTVDGTAKSFTANRSMTYNTNNGQCAIQPTAYVRINGVICPSSTQTQTAYFWENDDTGNGNLALAPPEWDVCYNDAVVNATFRDATEFNCNISVEPDKPNQAERHVQFVYGTNHNPAFTIRNLKLNDGSPVSLTDNNGFLVSPQTRGTAGLPIAGAYFGPVETVPFPADGPISVSFPMSAPADPNNAIGNRFEVTLFNWNACNPWNGDPVNPNYEDALQIQGFIEITDAPHPAFVTKDSNGNPTSDFCIGDQIFFANTTVNGDNYTWEFYDDAAGTDLLQTSTTKNPTYQFTSGGAKLIRLIARNTTAQSACTEEITGIVNITPSLTAKIGVSDLNGNPMTPDFCQEYSAPLSSFDVRFSDVSTGTVSATTVWRWEFYDENNNLAFEAPTGGAFSGSAPGPFDRTFVNRGIYRVKLRVRDNTTGCESSDEVHVRVFEKPQPAFSSSRVCQTTATSFADLSSLQAIAGEQIVSWEWDMDYDGTTFTKDGALDNKRNFDYTFSAPGSHEVALRVTTNGVGCSALVQQTVQVDAVPLAAFTADQTSGCSTLAVALTNNSVSGQPDAIKEFVWEVDDGSGFQPDSIQRPGDPGFSDTYVRNFVNTGTVNRDYRVRLRVVSVNNCDAISAPVTITVFPQPRSGFVSLNYSPFNDNCTPVSVNFAVDDQTKSLNPTDYAWIINDAAGLVDQISTGTTPSFQYSFNNTSQLVKDFYVTLRATLPSACYGDSTRTIRISPVPSSDFAVDTVSYACDRIILGMDASQKGLSKYTWTISINSVVVFSSTTDGEHVEYEITRSASADQHVDVDLQTQNLTNCESSVTRRTVLVTRADDFDASFTATPQQQTLPESTVTITNATNPGPWQYLWDFGDGTTSTDPAVSAHIYTTFGLYTISLTVNNDDCAETVSADVRINPIPPVLDFDYFPASGCAPHTVTFINKSRYADPATYVWKFGAQEGTSRAVDPTYTYARDGVYSVTLSATNELGDTVTITREAIIQVLPNPVAQFAVYPTTPVNVPGEVVYTDNRSRDASEYQWDFGDGYTSTEVEPQHKYTKEGSYDITLIATNGSGCADTTVSVSAVQAVNHGQLLIPNAFIPNKTGPGSANPMNNEVFLPIVQKVTKFQMLIFNRWGQLVFESSSPDVGWDGYYKGRLCAQDVYIYRVTAEYENGRTITRTGDVNLIR
jgi:gliding motility-associated-like protein